MSNPHRSLQLRARPDVTFDRVSFESRNYWIAKDPLALRFFQLSDEAHFIFTQLDGRCGFDQLRVAFERRFAPQRIRTEELFRYIARLHEQGLLYSMAPGQETVLEARGRTQSFHDLLRRLTNPLAIRFRGIDAQPWIEFLYPFVRPFLRSWVLPAALIWVVSAVSLVIVQWTAFLRNLPTHDQFFSADGLVWMLVTIGIVKVLHELGHALVCRHFGGQCHEIGLMFLFFAPCLYCNVSDAWRFPNKWHRIGVSAAGIYVELVIAATATFCWWFTSTGLFHHICFTTMAACSVNTLLLNGNPLLKYDGYYVLADFVEVPNLAERSADTFRDWISQWMWGRRRFSGGPALDRRSLWLVAYFIASLTYRMFLISAIVLLLIQRADAIQLGNFARGCLVLALGVPAACYLWRRRSVTVAPTVTRSVSGRAMLFGFALIGILIPPFLVPMPKCVWGTVEISLDDPQEVVIEIPGRLVECAVRPGQSVSRGTPLARLVNEDLELECAEIASSLEQHRLRLDVKLRERFDQAAAALEARDLEKVVRSLERKLELKRADLECLTLAASRDGIVFSGESRHHETVVGDQLRTWGGTALDPVNFECRLDRGTLLCEIGDPTKWQAFVVVDQRDLTLVQLDQDVELTIDGLPDRRFRGKVCEISGRNVAQISPQLSNKYGGDVPTATDSGGAEVPQLTSYQVRVELYDPEMILRRGLRGTARITIASEPLATGVVRWLRQTILIRT